MANLVNRILVIKMKVSSNPQNLCHRICELLNKSGITGVQADVLEKQGDEPSCPIILLTVSGEVDKCKEFAKNVSGMIEIISVDVYVRTISVNPN